MSLKDNAIAEFSRSPITIVSTVLGLIIAFASLVVAMVRPDSARTLEPQEAQAITFSASNLLLAISFFAALSLTSASMTRLLARKHEFGAFFLSIALAASTAFATYVVFNLAPPTPRSTENLPFAADLVYWSTLLVFVGFCGQPIMKILILLAIRYRGSDPRDFNEMNQKERERIWGALLIGAIILIAWGGMVAYGQRTLIRTFLPSSWQPVSKPVSTQSMERAEIELRIGKLGADEYFPLDIAHTELDTIMAFCDHTQIGTVDQSILRPGTYPTA